MTEEKKTITFVAGCLLVIAVGLFFLQSRKPPSVEIEDRMTAIQAAIENWYAAKGSPPENLKELGLPEEEIQDIVKVEFQYIVSDDGGTVTLLTLGGDRKVGGKMFNADRKLVFTLGEGNESGEEPDSSL